jgi:hypothetical protein
MTKSCALLNFDRLYVMSYDAIWKMDGKQIQVSVLLLSIFFPWNFTHVSKNRWGTYPVIKKKKCLLLKHEKNNQTLSNDWPTYCHTGILHHLDTLSRFQANHSLFLLLQSTCLAEKQDTFLLVLFEPTIYSTRDKHGYHHRTNVFQY